MLCCANKLTETTIKSNTTLTTNVNIHLSLTLLMTLFKGSDMSTKVGLLLRARSGKKEVPVCTLTLPSFPSLSLLSLPPCLPSLPPPLRSRPLKSS